MLKLNNNTKYTFTLNDPTHVLVKLVNIIGLDIAVLINGTRGPGSYEVWFDGSNSPAGIYYYKLFAEEPALNGAPRATNGCEIITLADYPGKLFKCIDQKEILIL